MKSTTYTPEFRAEAIKPALQAKAHVQGNEQFEPLVERRFWEQIATGITCERAAEAVGVSQAVGTRWFRLDGGTPLSMLNPISGRYLSFAEREEIGVLSCQSVGIREIARRIGHSASTGCQSMSADTIGIKPYYLTTYFRLRPHPHYTLET